MLKVRFSLLSLLLLMLPLMQGATNCTVVTRAATNCTAVTQIPSTECEALVALYKSTDGDNWKNNTGRNATDTPRNFVVVSYNSGWNVTNTPCNWDGVLCSGGHVSELSLSSNKLTGSVPTELGNLTHLTELYLYNNNLTGSIPTELGNLTHLTELYLYNNNLTGSIPTELGNLTQLTKLYLYNNNLTGSIPTELGNLTQLMRLDLRFNKLTGSIPTELGNLTHLRHLYLSNNKLTGSIPTELGNLTHLWNLYLSSNKLTGSIPTELGNLTQLTGLDLSSNQLTGSIPTELGNLTQLTRLYLSSNELCGEIPVELKNLSNTVLDDRYGATALTKLEANLKLDNNHLIAYDSSLIAWLDSRNPGWETTQTSCSGFFTTPIVKVAENSGTVTLTVQRNGDINGTLEIDYATREDSARQGHDYIGATGTLYWVGGDSTDKSFTITINDDSHSEINETFTMTLIDPVSGESLDNAIIIIEDNEPADCAAVTEIPYVECEALVALYNSTNGAKWRRNTGWNVTNTPCSWYGVSCSGGHISSLNLRSNKLTGSIPTELGNLAQLTALYLHYNKHCGEIPVELKKRYNVPLPKCH